mgnify:CR=1 FL=1
MSSQAALTGDAVKDLGRPIQAVQGLGAQAIAELMALAADITLLLDHDGVIQDVTAQDERLESEGIYDWIGRAWVDTVTSESRPKIQALLDDASETERPRGRQVSHPSPTGDDLPVVYFVLTGGKDGGYIAVGRDYRQIAVLQRKLVDAQQSVERDYSRLRHAETRYRLLFNVASEAMLILNASTQKIVELNPAARTILGQKAHKLAGRTLPESMKLQVADADKVRSLLETARATGRANEIRIRLGAENRNFGMSATMFRQDSGAFLLVRLSTGNLDPNAIVIPRSSSKLIDIVEAAPDGFVVTDPEGEILTANQAFLNLVQVPVIEQVRGKSLSNWLTRSTIDLNVMIANLRQRSSISLFSTTLQSDHGMTTEVEISGVAVLEAEEPCLGFMIRNVSHRLQEKARPSGDLPRSVDQLTDLVGRVSLRDIVRDTTDIIERLCIEAALELTNDNRASAAEMLGLSRQSLYVKLRRHNIIDEATGAPN